MIELFSLKGKTALITGGSQGIGRAITLAFAEMGADTIIINFRSGVEKAIQTKADAEKFGAKVLLWQFDLANKDVKSAWTSFAEANDCQADILVANASAQPRGVLDDICACDVDETMSVNVRSTIELIQAVVPVMKDRGWGRILNIGSVNQVRPSKQLPVYAASKAALINLVKNFATTLAPFGITINNLAPGVIGTARNDKVLSDETFKKDIESKIPVGKIGEPVDCAGTALLLCSDAGRYITGADYFVDGGFSLFM